MYKIDNVKKVLQLPEHMTEVDHISQYIMSNSNEPKYSPILKQYCRILRSASNIMALLNVDDQQVWCREDELQHWLDILPIVKDKNIICCYVAGSVKPLMRINLEHQD